MGTISGINNNKQPLLSYAINNASIAKLIEQGDYKTLALLARQKNSPQASLVIKNIGWKLRDLELKGETNEEVAAQLTIILLETYKNDNGKTNISDDIRNLFNDLSQQFLPAAEGKSPKNKLSRLLTILSDKFSVFKRDSSEQARQIDNLMTLFLQMNSPIREKTLETAFQTLEIAIDDRANNRTPGDVIQLNKYHAKIDLAIDILRNAYPAAPAGLKDKIEKILVTVSQSDIGFSSNFAQWGLAKILPGKYSQYK